MENRSCPICSETEAVPVTNYCRDHWILAACNACKHTYLRNPPGYAALVEEFAWEKTYVSEHERRIQESPIAYRLDVATRARHNWFRKPNGQRYSAWFGGGNILDIGCAESPERLKGFKHFGIEISQELARAGDQEMRKSGGYCIHGPGAEAIWEFEPDFFNGIVMRSYLEHEQDPLTVLKGASRVLNRDGAIYVRVPNYGSLNRKMFGKKWCGFRYPDHVNYFTISDLKRISAKAGLVVKLLNPFRVPVDDNINALLTRAL